MNRPVTVVDYGIGNLHSVVKALRHEGGEVVVVTSPEDLARAERLVLPGVGAFADSMRELETRGLVDALKTYFLSERPFLGICVGMQVLLSESEEFGKHRGLGLVPGKVVLVRPQQALKVPHIGWTALQPARAGAWEGTFLGDTKPGTMAYFVHSYSAAPENDSDVLAYAAYGGFRVTAAVRRGNAVGCQFHPEKSGPAGLAMIRRFLTG
jgi:glutamine amidotransferase